MDDRRAPVLGETGDVRKLIGQAGGGDDAACTEYMTAAQIDAEALGIAGDVEGSPGQHLCAVGAHLFAGDPQEFLRRASFVAEVAVHRLGRSVARFGGVDHDHGPTLSRELQGGREAGGGSADDRDIGVPGDGGRDGV